jgi:hypothetical protein
MPQKEFPPWIYVDPPEKTFTKLGRGKNPLKPEVLIKGNLPQFEKLLQRGLPPWEGVLTHGKIKPPDILFPPS